MHSIMNHWQLRRKGLFSGVCALTLLLLPMTGASARSKKESASVAISSTQTSPSHLVKQLKNIHTKLRIHQPKKRHTQKRKRRTRKRRRRARKRKRRAQKRRRRTRKRRRWIPHYLRYVAKKYVGYIKKMRRLRLIRIRPRKIYPFRRRIRKITSLTKLQKRLRRLVRHRWLRRAKIGLVVMTQAGKVLFQNNAKKLFIPASNVKILTISAAMHYLGPHYRFVTKIYGSRSIDEHGVLRGNLYLKGSGDPSLRTEDLWKISRRLYMLGLRKVTGRIYLDTTLFDKVHFGPGWEDHAAQPGERYLSYMPPVGALSLNGNIIRIGVRPGLKIGDKARITLDPRSYYVRRIINKVKTIRHGRFRVRIKMLSHRRWREKIVLKGTVPIHARPDVYRRRVTHPGWYTGFQFARALRSHRIRVSLWPRMGKVSPRAKSLYRHYSQPLGAILRYAGKVSSNFTTEMITKLMGVRAYRKPGSWTKGVNATRSFLRSLGIPPTSYKLLNGSGLSRGNRISPYIIATVLRKMLAHFATRPDFIVAQPIAGYDGTLRWRMKRSSARGVLRAKTGTLDGVSSLSGYVETANRKILIFSMLMNGRKWQGRYFRRIQNRVGNLLSRYVIPKK